MIERFDSSPLIELIAEVRWTVDAVMDLNVPFYQGASANSSEEFFTRLHSKLSSIGYGAAERLTPAGFPLMNQSAAFRYKRSVAEGESPDHSASSIFQAGAGLFSVHAVQPYKSWDQFRPVVQKGLEAFLAAKPPATGEFSLVLRYVDAFKDELTDGKPLKEFLADVMGIKVSIPDALTILSKDGTSIVPMIHVVIPLAFGSFQIQIAEGELQGEKVFLMENTVSIAASHGANVEKMLASLNEAREVLHKSFVGLTQPIHAAMGLSEGT